MKHLLIALSGLLLLNIGVAAEEINPVDIQEWKVPWEDTRPRDPYAVSQQEVWFVGQGDDYIAKLNPETGDFTRVELPDGAGPHNLIVDTDGTVWYAGNRMAHIGRYDSNAGDGKIHQIAMPDGKPRDPHTLVFDVHDNIWFTAQGGNTIGRLNKKTEKVDIIDVPTRSARPYGIVMDRAGEQPWIVLFGTNRLATVDPDSLELTEYELPREDTRPRRLEITSDGMIWYVDYAEGYLGRFNPENQEVEEWEMPAGSDARPYGMVVDNRDRLWFVETGPGPNRFVGFDPKLEEFFSITDIPSGGGAVRHMHYHEPTGSVWFGTDTDTIGRARVE